MSTTSAVPEGGAFGGAAKPDRDVAEAFERRAERPVEYGEPGRPYLESAAIATKEPIAGFP